MIKAILLFLFLAGPSHAGPDSPGVIHVCPECPISTLRQAVHVSQSGETIEVAPGIYPEGTIFIDKEIRVIGNGWPVIDGLHKGHVFYIRADNVHIEGLVIKNSGMSYISDYAGIRAEHVRRCVFRRNRLLHNTYGIYLAKVRDTIIADNTITGNATGEVTAGNGIHLFYSDHITASGNDISRHRDGLYFEFTEDSEVKDNFSHNNIRFGMHFMFSHRNRFERNIYTENPTGVAIMYSRRLYVYRNIFAKSHGNASYGFLIKEITDSKFIENIIRENTLGLMLNASNRNVFRRNDIRLNGWAAEIYTNSYDNTFSDNNFIGNQFDIATNSTRNTNVFSGNFWDKYRGYDLTRDGVGDVPYRPVHVFSFWVARYPELAILLNSPAVRFLETAERFFPVLTPKSLMDSYPKMKAVPAHGPSLSARISGFRERLSVRQNGIEAAR